MNNQKAKDPIVVRYIGVAGGPYAGVIVEARDALEFAVKNCGLPCTAGEINLAAPDAAEFIEMLPEWFFSGAWVAVEAEE